MQSDRPLRPISKEALADLQTWYPVDRWKTDPPADLFEIGLVLAGGQSSGCYLAGVLDFLFEALDCWQAARRAEPDRFPNHRVKIKILVGASAGGLNAALAAICGRYRFTPASHTRFEDGDKNLESPFYRAWVRDIDIIDLLSTDDLRIDGKNFSLLHSDYLERKVASYLNFGRDGAASAIRREWLDDPLPLSITVSNLEGVPFRIRFSADRSNGANDSSFPMTLHRDYLAFLRPLAKATQPPNIPDSDVPPFDNSNAGSGWQRLGQAVLATIAFPFALKRRPIERPSTDYDYRYVYPSDSGELVYAPGFPGDKPAERQFTAIDGGVFDNEPFELAHAALAGSMGTNKREGSLAKRAIILIDPFVTPKLQMSAGDDSMLLRFITKFWNSLIEQNRFKPIDLSLAEASDVYSRFMIGPLRRSGDKTARGDLALASHPLLNRRSKIASTLSIRGVATRSSTPRLQAELDAGSADWGPTPISCFRDGGICWRRSKPPSMRHALRSIAVSTRAASRKPLMGERHAGRGWLARSGL
ncbi:MAG TPA: patatin-like phospholipase family protein [Bradyrhizobium sp.]|nr:patatin-like phospholipase family protein [Bradyrhizobium sp.]